jgi:tRNA (mo5U34)-methyltransferase
MDYTQAECDKIWWWHSQSFPNGVRAKGHHDPSAFVKQLRLPDLTGKTVIDIGAWDGYYGFECERRGAVVTAADKHIWAEGRTGKQGFDFAKGALGSNVEDIVIDVLDLDKLERQFDVALFLGVLYHMRHPLLSLEKLASVTRDLAIIETHIDLLNEKRPAMAFYEGNELGNDPSNWFGPNPAAVCAMSRAAGFKTAEVVSQTGRLVVHARK